MPTGIFIALFGYLLGSVPTGIVLTQTLFESRSEEIGKQEHRGNEHLSDRGKTLGDLTLGRRYAERSGPDWMAIDVVPTRSMGYP